MRAPKVRGWGPFTAVAAIYLAVAWPGAGERGVIAEEVSPYLHRYPRVLARADEGGALFLPAHDAATPPGPGWVRTGQWPNLGWRGETRDDDLILTRVLTLEGLEDGNPLFNFNGGNSTSSLLLSRSFLS